MPGTLHEGTVGSIQFRATHASRQQFALYVNNYDILYCLQRYI